MKVLIVEDEPIIRQFCTLLLENHFKSVTVVEAKHANEAIDILNQDKSYDLIISDYDMPGGNGDELVRHLKVIEWTKPYLLHTSNSIEDFPYMKDFVESSGNRKYAQKPVRIKELAQIIASLIEPNSIVEDYKKIRISYFLRSNKSLCDIYIKLSDEKFVKIINNGDFYRKSDIDKYIKRNQKYLYVLHEDFESFANKLGQTPFLEFISDLDNLDNPEESLVRIHAVLKDLVESVGVDQYVIRLADSYVENVQKLGKENKSISEMLFKLRQRRDYLYDHSYMSACMATYIVKQLPWCSNEIIQKLCFSALFHDITISSTEVAMIHDLEDSKVRTLTPEELSDLKNHPKQVCDLLKDEKEYGLDIENILLTHHENGEGTGFPRGIDGSQIRPVSCVFIIAHEFVRQLYLHDFNESSHKDILTVLFNTYNSGNFKDILDALYNTLALNDAFEEGV